MERKSYLFSIILSFITIPFVFSQDINQEYIFTKDDFTEINTALNIGDNTFFGGSISSCRTGIVGIITSDNNNQFFENIELGYWGVDELELRSEDNVVIGSGYWYEGDDIPGQSGPYVFGMDADGNTVFSKFLSEIGEITPAVSSYIKTYLTHTISGGIVIAYGSYIAWLDSVGELQDSINYNYENDFKNIDRINDDILFAYTKRELLLINHIGEEINLINSDEDILDVYSDDENIYCLRTNDILIYDFNADVISYSTIYLNSIDEAKGITGNSNSLFLYEKGIHGLTNGEDQVIQLNKSDLSVVENTSFTFDKEETNIGLIIATENDLQIIGKEADFQPFIKSKPIFDELSFEDVEIELLSITPLEEIAIVDSIDIGTSYIYEIVGNIPYEFVVRNNSTEIVQSFSMTGNYLGGVNCSVFLYFNHYENLMIQPGETMTFTETVNFTGHYLTEPNYSTPNINVDVFGPNHRFDSDMSNNSMSEYTVVTATKELYELTDKWDLYPNPVKDNIHVDVTLKEKQDDIQIIIYNSIGEEVQRVFPNVNNLEFQEIIPVNDLVNGLYFLTISTRNGNETRSFIISQ